MLPYCLKCRKNTESKNPKIAFKITRFYIWCLWSIYKKQRKDLKI